MKLTIGENIKKLRKAQSITQEELSEMLGVSCQSVSRWELGICYPDMELLPALANIFKISVDKLLGVDEVMENQRVGEYSERFQAAISKGEIDECIRIAREGVAEHPNSYILLNKLMYALFVSGDESGNIPDWKENMERYDEEIIALGERIVKFCPDQSIRLEAASRLAFQHCDMGRKAIGRAVYETLPPQKWCRENQIWQGLEESEKLPFLRKKILEDYGSLYSSVWHLANADALSDKDSVGVMKKLFALIHLIYDGNPPAAWGTARTNCDIARFYVRLKDFGNAYKHLKIAVNGAKNFDARPKSKKVSALLLGEIEIKRLDFEAADSRSICEIMRDKWLMQSDFDPIRETDEFKELVKALTA